MQFKNMGKILSKYMNNFANATSLAKLRLTQMTILWARRIAAIAGDCKSPLFG